MVPAVLHLVSKLEIVRRKGRNVQIEKSYGTSSASLLSPQSAYLER